MRLVSSTRTGLALRDQSHAVGAIGAIGAIGDIVPATCISSDKRLNARNSLCVVLRCKDSHYISSMLWTTA